MILQSIQRPSADLIDDIFDPAQNALEDSSLRHHLGAVIGLHLPAHDDEAADPVGQPQHAEAGACVEAGPFAGRTQTEEDAAEREILLAAVFSQPYIKPYISRIAKTNTLLILLCRASFRDAKTFLKKNKIPY